MAGNAETLNNVSDTALSSTVFRAQEYERKRCCIKRCICQKMPGYLGYKMLSTIPHKDAMAFVITVRTSAIDRLIQSAIDAL